MSIDTLIEPQREIVIRPEMVKAFYLASKDKNKIHQGENAIVLGYQIDGLLRDYANALVESLHPGLQCSAQSTEFVKAIRVGSRVERYFPEATEEGNHTALRQEGENYVLKVALRKAGQNDARAIATFTYSPALPGGTNGNGGIPYTLRTRRASVLASGVGKQTLDFQLLALSLASHTLAQHGSHFIQLAGTYGYLPVYGLHQLNSHAPLTHLCGGDRIKIITNAAKVAERAVRQAEKAKKEAEEQKEDVRKKVEETLQNTKAIVHVEAVTPSSEIVYTGRLVLVLKKPEDIIRDAA